MRVWFGFDTGLESCFEELGFVAMKKFKEIEVILVKD